MRERKPLEVHREECGLAVALSKGPLCVKTSLGGSENGGAEAVGRGLWAGRLLVNLVCCLKSGKAEFWISGEVINKSY